MIEYIVLAAIAWLAVIVFIVLAVPALAGRLDYYEPSREYADDFAAKLSGSDTCHADTAPSDSDIVFATATPSTRRRTRLAAAHAPTSRKEATSTSYAFNETTEHATTAAASPNLYLVP